MNPMNKYEDLICCSDLVKQYIEYTHNSAHIKVDTLMSTVTITSKTDPESYHFMQDWQADEFIERARTLYEQMGDILFDDVVAFVAYDYLDCLE
jgi:hypothetical protein